MAEIEALGIRIDGVDNIDRAKASLSGFARAADDAGKSAERLGPSAKKAGDESVRANTRATQSADRLNRSYGVLNNTLANTARQMLTIAGIGFGTAALIRYVDAWSDMRSNIGAATGDMDGAADRMKRLVDIANASYSPLQQTAQVYARNVATFRDLGRSASDAADFTEAVNNALVTTATRGQNAEVVINSLSRALAIGRLDADAFDTIVSRSPRVLKAMADEMGVTTSQLRAFASQGKVTGAVISESLINSLESLRKEAELMPATIGDGFTRINNNITEFIGKLDQASGASSAIAGVLLDFADGIRTTGDYLIRFGAAIAPAMDLAIRGLSWVAQYADIAVAAIAGFYAPAVLGGIALLTRALAVGLVGALRAVALAMAANPIGAIVAVLATASYAVYRFRDTIKEVFGVNVGEAARTAAGHIATYMMVAIETLKFEFRNFGDSIGSAFVATVNASIWAINKLIAASTAGIDFVIRQVNKIPGTPKIPQLGEMLRIDYEENPYADRLRGAIAEQEALIELIKTRDNLGVLLRQFEGAGGTGTGPGADNGGNPLLPGDGASKEFDNWIKQQLQAVRNATLMAEAYLLGGEAISKATRQQEINNLVLEHGEKARNAITIAVNAHGKAMDRLDITKQINGQRLQNDQLAANIKVLHAQSRGVAEGEAALEAYNRELALSALLAGKTREEVADLIETFTDDWNQGSALQREVTALETINGLIDSTATKQEKYTAEMARLVALRPYAKTAEQVMALDRAIQQLERDNNEWLTFTEQAIERIDQSFADMWQNVVDGTATSFDAMKQGFKQMLAEMAHAAITRPIMISVGNALMGASRPGGMGEVWGGGFGMPGGFSGGSLSGTVSQGIDFLGQRFGSSALQSFAGGMQGIGPGAVATVDLVNGTVTGGASGSAAAGATFAQGLDFAGQALGYGKALYDLTQGNYGSAAGAAIGTYILPGIGTAIGSMLGGMLDESFKGETRFGAGYMVDPATGRASRTGGPSGGDSAATSTITAIEGVWSATEQLASRLGGSLAGLSFGAGSELSPEKGNSFVWSSWGRTPEEVSHITGMRDLGGVTDGGVVAQEFAIELQRSIIRGLQMADVDEHWREWINQFDVSALDEAGVQNVMATIEALVQLRDVAMNMGMESLANATAQAQANIIALSGGIDGFTTNLAAYYQAFYSEAERTANLQATLTKTMQDLGYELPETHAAFRALVEAQDLTTESGQQAYATLIGISGAFDQLVTSLDGLGGAVSDTFNAQLETVRTLAAETNRLLGARNRAGTVLGQIDRAMGRADGFGAQREAELWAAMATASYEQQIELAQELTNIVLQRYQDEIASAEQLRDLGRSLREYVQSLTIGELSPLTLGEKLAEAGADYAATLAKAQAGDVGAMGQLQGAADAYLRLARDYYASSDEYTRIFGYVTGSLDTLGIQAMSDAERQLGVSEDSLGQLTELRSVAQRSYNLLDAQYQTSLQSLQIETAKLTEIGVNTGRLHDIASILAGMPAEIAARLQGILGGAASGVVGGWYQDAGFSDQVGQDYWADQLQKLPQDQVRQNYLESLVTNWYKDNLGWSPDGASVEYWAGIAQQMGASEAYKHWAHSAGLPGYLNGGFADGLAMVGEAGPEIVDFTKTPGRVYTNSQLSSAMGMGQASAEEIRALRKEMAEQSKMLAMVIAQSSQANAERVSGAVESTSSRSEWNKDQQRYAVPA